MTLLVISVVKIEHSIFIKNIHKMSLSSELKRFESYDISLVNESHLLYGKTIQELKEKKDIKSVILRVSKMEPGPLRDYLDKWLFDTYYEKKIMRGNLTQILKTSINNKVSYREIMRRCFDSVDILHSKRTIKDILNKEVLDIVEEMHSINAGLTGTFFDYLIRRTISELKSIPFYDTRAEGSTLPYNNDFATSILKENVKISDQDYDTWEFVPNEEFGSWSVRESPKFESKIISNIQQGEKFIVLEKQEIWMKIFYKNKVGWVRHKIPNCENFHTMDITNQELVENIYLRPFEKNFHYCQFGCKYSIEQSRFRGNEEMNNRNCYLPVCQNLAYALAKDTHTYATENILPDIFICSLSHTEAFGGKPNQEQVMKMYKLLSNETISKKVYTRFESLSKELIQDKTTLLLNPPLGCCGIPADADLIIDDTLYDIKCTRSKTKDSDDIYEIEQLLGYVSLYTFKEKKNKIKRISILNLLEGKQKDYTIDYITQEQLSNYLKMLSRC